MATTRQFENPVDVVRKILEAGLFNPHSGCDVEAGDILQYLSEFPNNELIIDRLDHFKKWLEIDPSCWLMDDAENRNGMYYDTEGLLCNPDGTPNQLMSR